MMVSISPATEEVLKEYTEMNETEVEKILIAAEKEFYEWKKTTFNHRSKLMNKAAEVLLDKKEDFAKIMTLEMGKPISQARGEVEKCAWVCKYYAENAETFLKDEIVKTESEKSFVTFNPLGVVLAVMPWNFPFWQVFRFAAPALMAGNAGVLKHSSNVSGCALAIEYVFNKAGFPKNLFRTLIVSSGKVESIINNPIIKAVSLTGSTIAGKSVGKAAGNALKKSVLELGGSDPYIILEDADLEKAAQICVNARLINSGQSCIAAKRFIVVDKVFDEFERLFTEYMFKKHMGDPFNEENEIGPQARIDLRDELHKQVEQSIQKGARLVLGGQVPDMKGAYYPATILSDVEKGMPAYDEELFGPVAALIRAKDEKDAINKANDSVFGLGSAIFTKNIKRAEEIAANELQAGCCFINDSVKSDPRLPFGGIKESGYGRELSAYGIKEFVNIKSVVIQK